MTSTVSPPPVRARAVDHLAVAVGTSKGLFLVSDGVVDGPLLKGDSIAAFVQSGSRYIASATNPYFGPCLRVSDDGGLTWSEPDSRQISYPADTGASLAAVWQIHLDRRPGHHRTIWLGTEPAALFRSNDAGATFSLVRGLWDHPQRATWTPGGGGLILHTILTQPERPGRVVVAISAGGVYRSDDGGETFAPKNKGLEARFLPDPFPEHGQCPHKLAVDAGDPDTFWLQNHWGIYRSEDSGDSWISVGRAGEEDGVSSDFGFPIVSHPVDPGTAFVFPLESDQYRCSPNGRCSVARTIDNGQTWVGRSRGLPTNGAQTTVLRDAFAVGSSPPYPLVFGTRSGHVFASVDGGDSWRLVTSYLPPVLCVSVLE